MQPHPRTPLSTLAPGLALAAVLLFGLGAVRQFINRLNDIPGVAIGTPTDGDALVWDDTAGVWTNAATFGTGDLNMGGHSVTNASSLVLSNDVVLIRDAANTLAQRNGTTAQTNRIYGTYTDSSNYERLAIGHDGTTSFIRAQTAGTGDDDQGLQIRLSGTGALYVDGDTAGNARGANSIDLQTVRESSATAATGAKSVTIGSSCRATAEGSVAIGDTAFSSSTGAVALGKSTTTSAPYAFAAGSGSSAAGTASSALGFRSSAYLYGHVAYASGYFASIGDAQQSTLVARNTTAGSTSTLFLDGSSSRIVLPANTTWTFEITIAARSTDGGTGNEESAAYKYVGCIERDGANNTALVGSVTETVIAEDDAGWSVAVTADDTNEALNIDVTSDDANTVRWVAKIALVEVGG